MTPTDQNAREGAVQSNDELLADAHERLPRKIIAGVLAYAHASANDKPTGWLLSQLADEVESHRIAAERSERERIAAWLRAEADAKELHEFKTKYGYSVCVTKAGLMLELAATITAATGEERQG